MEAVPSKEKSKAFNLALQNIFGIFPKKERKRILCPPNRFFPQLFESLGSRKDRFVNFSYQLRKMQYSTL